jgi:hypothetical protein
LEAAQRAASEDGTPLAAWYIAFARASLAFVIDQDFPRCYRDATALENEWYAAGHGPGWETDIAMHFSLASQHMLGELRDLARRVNTLVQRAKRNGDLFQEVTLRVRFAVRHLIDGRDEEARLDVEDALARWLPDTETFGNQRAWGLWSLTRVALYAGRLDTDLDEEWAQMRRSLIGRMQVTRLEWLHTYGLYLLGKAILAERRGRKSTHAALCREADHTAGRIAKLAFPAAPAAAAALRASIAWVRGEGQVAALEHAIELTAKQKINIYVPFFKRRLGEVRGGDEGAALIAEADVQARELGWRDPERGAELAVPTGRFT